MASLPTKVRAGARGAIPDPDAGGGIKGEALPEVISAVEMAVLNAGALSEGLDEARAATAQRGPAQNGGGRRPVRGPDAGGDQQQPVPGTPRRAGRAPDLRGWGLRARRDSAQGDRGIGPEVPGGSRVTGRATRRGPPRAARTRSAGPAFCAWVRSGQASPSRSQTVMIRVRGQAGASSLARARPWTHRPLSLPSA